MKKSIGGVAVEPLQMGKCDLTTITHLILILCSASETGDKIIPAIRADSIVAFLKCWCSLAYSLKV